AIEYVKEHGKITNGEYQTLFDVSESTALRDLKNMVKIGLFDKIGNFKEASYQIQNMKGK
ncbi:MAG: DeoR family transcriptional regulator, partial [Candidatus Delongbacteria bacterium]|nr:DeoR family transcriptional regulator [Candidatus Delongbacteria bacterium]